MANKPQSNVLHVSVELGGRVFQGDLETEARVDWTLDGLNQALAEHPGRFAWWATLEVLARTQEEGLERQRAMKHAELYSHYEATLSSTDVEGKRSKPTVEKVKSEVLKSLDYRAVQERLAAAAEAHGLLTVARQTMLAKKDALIAIASNLRAQRDAYISDHLSETRRRIHDARGPASGGQ